MLISGWSAPALDQCMDWVWAIVIQSYDICIEQGEESRPWNRCVATQIRQQSFELAFMSIDRIHGFTLGCAVRRAAHLRDRLTLLCQRDYTAATVIA
jgi:hypothetical protein